jgi:hypothetical protein
MKPVFIRRFRRRAAIPKSEGAFFKKEGPEAFFGNAEQQSFFSPSPVLTSQGVQRKCEECEKEDKEVQRQPEKKEEEKVMRAIDKKEEEEKVQRQPEKKEEEKLQRAEDKKEEEKVQRAAEEKKEEEKVQKKESGSSVQSTPNKTSSYISTLSGKGQPLPASANYFFSSRMGQDFSGVKIHSDKDAAESAKDVRAKAYTVGSNIVFNEGQYNVESIEGKKLMAHELTHVVQQKGNQKIQRRPARRQTTVKPPPIVIDTGPQKQDPFGVTPRGPRYMPDPNDNSTDNLVQLKARENKRAWKQAQLEIPILTTEPGGEAPGFISVEPGGYYEDHQIGRIYFERKKFHLLEKIEHDFSKADDSNQLLAVWNYYQDWFKNTAKFCKEGEPDFDPIIYSKYMMYYVPDNINVMQVRRQVVDAMQRRIQVIKEKQHKLNVLKVLQEAEEFALQGQERTQGACDTKLVPRKGGDPLHNQFAAHVAGLKGAFATANAETEVTTPEGVSYTFDVLNSKAHQAYEVKTRHQWGGDVGIGGTLYWPGFIDRAMKLDFQRLKGLYVANRCGLDYRYVFDSCEAALGMRKQWSNIPPIEYIPFPGKPRENCS